jgi:hypothetical protein
MDNDKKVIFLAHRNDTPTATTEMLTCGGCANKTWVAEYGGSSEFPRMNCSACGTLAGYFGWIDNTEALTE